MEFLRCLLHSKDEIRHIVNGPVLNGADWVLRLTSLAPDIIEAILRGDEPGGLSPEKPGATC